MAEQFLSSLPKVSTSDLPADSMTCTICSDEYGTASGIDKKAEHPVRLPCSHIVGAECIAKWLTERSNSCPYCRHEFFPRLSGEEGFDLGDDDNILDDNSNNDFPDDNSDSDPDSDVDSGHIELDGAPDRQRALEPPSRTSVTFFDEVLHMF